MQNTTRWALERASFIRNQRRLNTEAREQAEKNHNNQRLKELIEKWDKEIETGSFWSL